MNFNFSIKINLFKPRKKKKIVYQPSAPPYYDQIISIKMTKTWCVGGKRYSDTNNITEYEKRNPMTKKLVKIIQGKCTICGRIKSQIFTK